MLILPTLVAAVALLVRQSASGNGQIDPFAREIAAFKNADQKSMPPKGEILFVGSSSFTKWTDVQDYFPTHPLINRGFGGSTLLDVTRHLDDVVFPYSPKQIVIYCGENDFAADARLEPIEVFNRFRTMFKLIRTRLKDVPIVYVSMKPSPSRWQMRTKFETANRKIADFLKHQRSAQFLDVWPVMLNENGVPKPDIFLSDRLHMNADGYHLWQPLLEPLLLKD